MDDVGDLREGGCLLRAEPVEDHGTYGVDVPRRGPRKQRPALVGQRGVHRTLVVGAGLAPDETVALQPGHGVGVPALRITGHHGQVAHVSGPRHPRRTLNVLVPIVLLVSFVPDILVGVTRALPGTSWTAVAALMVMHLVVAACAVAAYRRFLPVRAR